MHLGVPITKNHKNVFRIPKMRISRNHVATEDYSHFWIDCPIKVVSDFQRHFDFIHPHQHVSEIHNVVVMSFNSIACKYYLYGLKRNKHGHNQINTSVEHARLETHQPHWKFGQSQWWMIVISHQKLQKWMLVQP